MDKYILALDQATTSSRAIRWYVGKKYEPKMDSKNREILYNVWKK